MTMNIAVFFGGDPSDREISIHSAHHVMHALDTEKYHAIPVYIREDGTFWTGDILKEITSLENFDPASSKCEQISIIREENTPVISPVKQKLLGRKQPTAITAAIPLVYGRNGESASLTGFLNTLKIPHTGSEICSSAVTADKVLMKNIISDNGLPVTRWFHACADDMKNGEKTILDQVHKLIYPVILKPARTGSLRGASIARNDEEYINCFSTAAQYDHKIITEKVIRPMTVLTCSVLGNHENAQVSVIAQAGTVHNGDLPDPAASLHFAVPSSNAGIVPAPLSPLHTELIQKLALTTFRAFDITGVACIDFMMDTETKKVYVNGITANPVSLSVYLWQESGMTSSKLLDRLIELALEH